MSFQNPLDQYQQSALDPRGQSSCFSSGLGSGRGSARALSPVDDPLRFAAMAPDLWMAFLHRTCRGVPEVMVKYGVCERAARKWWEGVGGCRMDKVQIAMRVDRRAALDMLFPE